MHRFALHGMGVLLLVGACVAARMMSLAVITGGSMSPTLLPGDACIVLKTTRVERNDLILFAPTDGERVVVHRVVSKRVDGILTKGDANATMDRDPVSPDRIRGRVVYVVRLGRVLAWLDSVPPGDTLRSQSHSRR